MSSPDLMKDGCGDDKHVFYGHGNSGKASPFVELILDTEFSGFCRILSSRVNSSETAAPVSELRPQRLQKHNGPRLEVPAIVHLESGDGIHARTDRE